ncbi:MAG: aromatic amino acid lyase, partial [Phycisphaerales bacterium]|nr:aromatic amino acid lyase [Phycisphaerales bacterium]
MPETTGNPVILNGDPLSTRDVVCVAREHAPVQLDDEARNRMQQCRETVEKIADDTTPVYGINTGFGSLSQVRIGHEGLLELQRNIVHSHAAGVGEPLPCDVVRAIMLVLAASLARGYSGVRPEVVDQLLFLLEHNMTPVV